MNKYLKDGVIITFGSTLNQFMQWAILVVAIRISGFSDDTGNLSLAISISMIFSTLSLYGLRSFQISDTSNQIRDAVYINTRLITCAVGFILCVLYCIILNLSFPALILTAIYMMYKSAEAFTDVLHGIFQKHGKLVFSGISLIIKSIVNFISFVLVYIITENMLLSVLSMLLSSIFVLFIYDCRKTLKFMSIKQSIAEFSFSNNKPLLKIGFFTMLVAVSTVVFAVIPRLILERHYSTQVLSIFYSLVTPTTVIISVASLMLIPFIQKLSLLYTKEKKHEFLKLVTIIILLTALLGFIAYVAAYYLGDFFLVLIYGFQISEYAYVLNYLIINVLLVSINGILKSIYVIARKVKTLTVIAFTGCIICFILSTLLIPDHGIDGAAYSLIIAQAIQLVILTIGVVNILFKSMSKS